MRYMTFIVGAFAVLVFGIIVIGLISPERRTSQQSSKPLPTNQRSNGTDKQAKTADLPNMVHLRRCSYDDSTWTIIHKPPNMVLDIRANARQVHLQFKDQHGQWVDNNDQSLTARWFRICARAPNASYGDKDLDQEWLPLNWKQINSRN